MEDHLKNKNRLEKEWEALCAYQAEPSSSLVAQREENLPKNRCPAVLTCTYRPAPGSPLGLVGLQSSPSSVSTRFADIGRFTFLFFWRRVDLQRCVRFRCTAE